MFYRSAFKTKQENMMFKNSFYKELQVQHNLSSFKKHTFN